MRKHVLMALVIILFIFGIFLGISKTKANLKTEVLMDKKVLVTYFSWTGNTKSVAEKIHNQVGGEILPIEPVTPYTGGYNEVAYGIAKEQNEKNVHPPVKAIDVTGYDVIFVGTPAWWYTMAPPVKTFLEENNFEGKTIVPFITHGGGGKYTIAQDMGNLAKGAKVLSPFVVYGGGDASTEKEITDWLNNLKF